MSQHLSTALKLIMCTLEIIQETLATSYFDPSDSHPHSQGEGELQKHGLRGVTLKNDHISINPHSNSRLHLSKILCSGIFDEEDGRR